MAACWSLDTIGPSLSRGHGMAARNASRMMARIREMRSPVWNMSWVSTIGRRVRLGTGAETCKAHEVGIEGCNDTSGTRGDNAT